MLVAFALAIMADPISSVAYAIEAALGELNGDLRLILPTMGLVVLVIAFVLMMNLARVTPLASLGATLLIASGLYWLWVKNGRPRGIAGAETTE